MGGPFCSIGISYHGGSRSTKSNSPEPAEVVELWAGRRVRAAMLKAALFWGLIGEMRKVDKGCSSISTLSICKVYVN